ncbi:hypothetical protein CHH83_23915 [Bacillus sp. 7586-K]|uniref:DUF4097 family beta strand repeat-containing protein n=1 Tax=Metabacillus niabensis TaxID=324854 RepID=UPI000BA7D06A|nr:hypothetical protein CHH83_23915 [Bacillus sp. 7586-K]
MKRIIVIFIVFIAIGGFIYSFNRMGGIGFQKEESFDFAKIKDIEINNESWDVEFKHSESKRITIAAKGKQKDNKSVPVTIEHKGNKLVVNQINKKEKGVLQGFSFGKVGKISISIPDNETETITLSNRSGDIEIKNIALSNLDVSNISGSETITGLSVKKGTFTSKEGELNIKNSSLNELSITSQTSDSYITNITSPKIKITSTDGEVLVKEAKEGDFLFVETKSGDISVAYKEDPKSLLLTANNDAADITVGLDNMKKIKNTGKAKEGMIGDAANHVKLVSKHGTISIK